MAENLSKQRVLLIAAAGISLVSAGCLGSHPKIHVIKDKSKAANTQPAKTQPANTQAANAQPDKTPPAKAAADTSAETAEPDKVLYDRSLLDMKKGHYTESRLSLQTLINTYPDSEYLAKAKLMVADSFYKEGGTSNLTQSIDEYKNFIVFFPFLDEAAYAQMQVGMAHYRMMEKSDRDNTNAQAAEDAFQTFLLKYPTSPLVSQAEQHLRDVQEVLADGEYKIARFYFVKQDFPASAARLVEMVDRYPLYSQSDEALWMLGDVYERAKQLSKNEDTKNHFADLAAKCYNHIIEDYPMSVHVADAKSRLTAMGMPVPTTDPTALARMQNQQMYEKTHRQAAAVKLPMQMLHSGPDVTTAAHSGTPNLNPPTDAVSATDVLKPSSEGPTFSMAAPPSADADAGTSSPPIEAVQGSKQGDAPITGTAVQIIDPPAGNPPAATSSAAPTSSTPQPNSAPPSTNSSTGNSQGADVPFLTPTSTPSDASKPSTPATAPEPAPTTPPVTTPAPPNGAQPAGATIIGTQGPAIAQPTSAKSDKPGSESSSASSPAAATAAADKTDTKKESTSKKKKGLKKLIPW